MGEAISWKFHLCLLMPISRVAILDFSPKKVLIDVNMKRSLSGLMYFRYTSTFSNLRLIVKMFHLPLYGLLRYNSLTPQNYASVGFDKPCDQKHQVKY